MLVSRFPKKILYNPDLEVSAVASSRLAIVLLSLVTLIRLHAHISPIVRTGDSVNERFPVRSQRDVRPVYPSFQLG